MSSGTIVRKWERYVNRESMTAPHYLANRYILENVPVNPNATAVDFGCRDSLLPTMLADGIVGSVVAVDRDPVVMKQTAAGVTPLLIETVAALAEWAEIKAKTFDVVVACWAIQHNSLSEQSSIAASLGRLLKEGGRLVVVSSLSDKIESGCRVTWYNSARIDAQYVLSLGDVDRYIATPSQLSWKNTKFFWYEHGSRNGDYVDYHDKANPPNAIGYVLEKLR